MILQPARIVLIDDKAPHLKALADALGILGSASLSYHYTDEHPSSLHLSGARLIFCDLHLTSDAATTDSKVHCANIASMLDACLADDHGPYLLVIWSQFPDDVEILQGYLDELPSGKSPIKFACLNKNKYIEVDTGDPTDPSDLQTEIRNIVNSQQGLATLLQWEQTVALAAARTTTSLWEICAEINPKDADKALRRTLGKLVRGAFGKTKAENNPGRSLLEVLGPLLADRIEAQSIDAAVWAAGIDVVDGPPVASSARLYGALHIENPTNASAIDRGVVSSATDYLHHDKFVEKIGYSAKDILKDCGFKGERLDPAEKAAEWYLVQICAACDQAQGKLRLLPYCLAVTVPAAIKPDSSDGVQKTRAFMLDQEVILYLHGGFVFGETAALMSELNPKFRIRTALLDKLVLELRSHSARIGVTEP